MWLECGLFQQHTELEDRILQQDFQNFNVTHGTGGQEFPTQLMSITKERGGKIFPMKQITKRTDGT